MTAGDSGIRLRKAKVAASDLRRDFAREAFLDRTLLYGSSDEIMSVREIRNRLHSVGGH